MEDRANNVGLKRKLKIALAALGIANIIPFGLSTLASGLKDPSYNRGITYSQFTKKGRDFDRRFYREELGESVGDATYFITTPGRELGYHVGMGYFILKGLS